MAASLESINECPVRLDLNGENVKFVTTFEQGRHRWPCGDATSLADIQRARLHRSVEARAERARVDIEDFRFENQCSRNSIILSSNNINVVRAGSCRPNSGIWSTSSQ
ncbi:hypothetical protein A9W93_10415 [Mycobacterium colombiense]|nr:hypothetical protein A9W93_10415 [Mycobacterium colombiense]